MRSILPISYIGIFTVDITNGGHAHSKDTSGTRRYMQDTVWHRVISRQPGEPFPRPNNSRLTLATKQRVILISLDLFHFQYHFIPSLILWIVYLLQHITIIMCIILCNLYYTACLLFVYLFYFMSTSIKFIKYACIDFHPDPFQFAICIMLYENVMYSLLKCLT